MRGVQEQRMDDQAMERMTCHKSSAHEHDPTGRLEDGESMEGRLSSVWRESEGRRLLLDPRPAPPTPLSPGPHHPSPSPSSFRDLPYCPSTPLSL